MDLKEFAHANSKIIAIFAEKRVKMELINKTVPSALILIGNGFDVAHGFKTRYSDFYNNCEELKSLANNGNLLCQHILNNVTGDMWQDLECGLYDYSKELTKEHGNNDKVSSEVFRIEFLQLRGCLFSYIRKAINNSPSDNPGHFIAKLTEEWLRMNYQILTFNYSYVVAAYTQDALKSKKDFSFNSESIIFQHGSLYNHELETFNDADKIVLGIDDAQKVDRSHSFLYKSMQNIHNIKNFIRLIKEKELYIIYGCSMGASDAFYFRRLFGKTCKNKTFLIYAYGRKALDSIKENIHEFTEGLSMYIAETNNDIIFIDCSNQKKALLDTKKIINKIIMHQRC